MAKVYFASARVKKWKYSESRPGKLDGSSPSGREGNRINELFQSVMS